MEIGPALLGDGSWHYDIYSVHERTVSHASSHALMHPGITIGMATVQWFDSKYKQYNWQGLSELDSLQAKVRLAGSCWGDGGCGGFAVCISHQHPKHQHTVHLLQAKRSMAQLLPYSWTKLEWMVFAGAFTLFRPHPTQHTRMHTRPPPPGPKRFIHTAPTPTKRPRPTPPHTHTLLNPPPPGPKRFLQAMVPVLVMLTFELNVFFLKYALWVPPTNPLVTYRLLLWCARCVCGGGACWWGGFGLVGLAQSLPGRVI